MRAVGIGIGVAFIRALLSAVAGPAAGDGLLLEDDTSFLLLEDGSFLLLE